MLTISHESLPTKSSPFKACAPVLVMPGNLQPTVFIDPYADTRSNNFDAISYPIPDPYEISYYYRISIADISSIKIDGYTNLEFPSLLVNKSFWLDEGSIHLCSLRLEEITIDVVYQIQIPIDVTSKLSIKVLSAVNIQNLNCPDKGIFNISFIRDGDDCILDRNLYNNLLEFGDIIEVNANQVELLGAPLAQIAFFDLTSPVLIPEIEQIGEYWETENNELILNETNIRVTTENWSESVAESLVYPPELTDVFDYLDRSYRLVVNDFSPEVGEFFLENGIVKVFISADALILKNDSVSFNQDSGNSSYTKSIGSISFQCQS